MSIADAVAALADGINGCALGRGADTTDALHGNRSVDQGFTAARGRLAHLICSSKSLLREKRSMVRSSSPQKNRGWPGFCSSFAGVSNAQAFEGLVVSAADMAEARSMHPATARKPMDQGDGTTHSSFPQLASAFVAVGTEFGRTLLSVALGLIQRHLLAVKTRGAQQFPLVTPVRRHRTFDAHGATFTAK